MAWQFFAALAVSWLLAKNIKKPKQETGVKLDQQKAGKAQFLYGEFTQELGQAVRTQVFNYPGRDDNKILARQINWSVAENGIESIDEVQLDEFPITDKKFGSDPQIGIDGSLQPIFKGGYYAQVYHSLDGSDINIKISSRTGSGYYENPVEVTTDGSGSGDVADLTFEGKGCAFSVFIFTYDLEKMPALPNITASGKGRKIENLLTGEVEYSNNPADIAYDYATHKNGGGIAPAFLRKADFIKEREFCNTTVTEYQGSAATRPIMSLNIRLGGDDTGIDNLNLIRSSCRASMPDIDGEYAFIIERERDPIEFEINDSNRMSDLVYEDPDAKDVYTHVIVGYYAKEEKGQESRVQYPEDETANVAANNGISNPYDKLFEGINNHAEALQMAELIYNRSKNAKRATISTTSEGKDAHVGQVVNLTSLQAGITTAKPFIIEEKTVKPNGTVEFLLVEYQQSIYPWVVNPQPDFPDTTLPEVADVATPTELTVSVDNDGYGVLSWVSAHKKFIVEIDTSSELIDLGEVPNKSVRLPELAIGDYVFRVAAKNALGYTSNDAILEFEVVTPAAPTVTTKNDAISITVEPSLTGSYFSTSFELVLGELDDVTDSENKNYGLAGNWTVTGLKPNTEYFIFVRTVNVLGNSAWTRATVTTDAQAQNIVDAVDGLIEIENLAQSSQDTINQIQNDIVSNTDSAASSQFAVNVLRQQVEQTEVNLSETFESAFTVITDNVLFRQELVGFKAEINTLENQVAVNATNISQSATSIQLEALEVELRGEIQSIVTGDIDAILDAAIGDIQGTVTKLEFFVGEDNLDGQQTIGALVNEIVLEKDYVTISDVQFEIDSGGITGIVSETTFNNTVTTINSNIEQLNANTRFEYLSSFAFETNKNESINAAVVEANLRLMNNNLSLKSGLNDFEGSLATAKNETKVLTDELSAEVVTTTEQLARLDNNITSTNTVLNNVVNENEVLASSITELNAELQTLDGAVSGQIQRVDQVEIDISDNSDSIGVNATAISAVQATIADPATGLTASYNLAQLAKNTADSNSTSITTISNNVTSAQSTADSALTLATTADGKADGAQSTADTAITSIATLQTEVTTAQSTAGSALTLSTTNKSEINTLNSQFYLSANVNDKIVGVKGSIDDNDSKLVFLGDAMEWQNSAGDSKLKLDTVNDSLEYSGVVDIARGANRVVINPNSDLMFWFGDKDIAAGSRSKANGKFWINSDGEYSKDIQAAYVEINANGVVTQSQSTDNIIHLGGFVDSSVVVELSESSSSNLSGVTSGADYKKALATVSIYEDGYSDLIGEFSVIIEYRVVFLGGLQLQFNNRKFSGSVTNTSNKTKYSTSKVGAKVTLSDLESGDLISQNPNGIQVNLSCIVKSYG